MKVRMVWLSVSWIGDDLNSGFRIIPSLFSFHSLSPVSDEMLLTNIGVCTCDVGIWYRL